MLTNAEMTFDDIVTRHGEISAWHYLAEIEKAAGIKPRHEISDPEVRLVYALRLQDTRLKSTKRQVLQGVAA